MFLVLWKRAAENSRICVYRERLYPPLPGTVLVFYIPAMFLCQGDPDLLGDVTREEIGIASETQLCRS